MWRTEEPDPGGGDGDDRISVGYRRDIGNVYGDTGSNGMRGNESDDFIKGGDGDNTMYGEHARAPVRGGEEKDEGGGGLSQRREREHAGDRDSVEEQRRVGAKALPHDGRPRSSSKTEPTTFETLTLLGALAQVISLNLLLTNFG
jgi:hypothetical protein